MIATSQIHRNPQEWVVFFFFGSELIKGSSLAKLCMPLMATGFV